MFSNIVWIAVVVLSSAVGGLAVKRLVAGTKTAGSLFMVASPIFLIIAGIIGFTTQPTIITNAISLGTVVLGLIAALIAQYRNARERKQRSRPYGGNMSWTPSSAHE